MDFLGGSNQRRYRFVYEGTATLEKGDVLNETRGTVTVRLPMLKEAVGGLYSITCRVAGTCSVYRSSSDAGDIVLNAAGVSDHIDLVGADKYAVLYCSGKKWYVVSSLLT